MSCEDHQGKTAKQCEERVGFYPENLQVGHVSHWVAPGGSCVLRAQGTGWELLDLTVGCSSSGSIGGWCPAHPRDPQAPDAPRCVQPPWGSRGPAAVLQPAWCPRLLRVVRLARPPDHRMIGTDENWGPNIFCDPRFFLHQHMPSL